MKRTYTTGTADKIKFFIGSEVEKTPAFGMQTLFVVGLHKFDDIQQHLTDDIKHIFFGANHSFDPMKNNDWEDWDQMISKFLLNDLYCSLDIPINAADEFCESILLDFNNFIPQIRIPLPYIKQYNYNTMIKIDDKDFKATNPGVWCHNLHDLMDREKFTDWREYSLDTIIK